MAKKLERTDIVEFESDMLRMGYSPETRKNISPHMENIEPGQEHLNTKT